MCIYIHICTYVYMVVSKIYTPKSSILIWIFHSKPSMLGYPHGYGNLHIFGKWFPHSPAVLRVVEVCGDVQQVIHTFVEVVQVRGHVLQPLLGQLQTASANHAGDGWRMWRWKNHGERWKKPANMTGKSDLDENFTSMFNHESLSCCLKTMLWVQVSLVEVVRLLLETALIRLELILKVCNALAMFQAGDECDVQRVDHGTHRPKLDDLIMVDAQTHDGSMYGRLMLTSGVYWW